MLAASDAVRGAPSSREVVGEFEITAAATVVSSGGIGGNHDLARRQWPERLGTPPEHMITGVPAYVDGSMQPVTAAAGARLINGDRMWPYVEGIQHWDPIWPGHGIRILPGPSSIWLDATGARLPVPLFPGFDTLGTLAHLRQTGHDHSWFVLSQKIVEKEFTLSGSEQNPDLTGKDLPLLVRDGQRFHEGRAGRHAALGTGVSRRQAHPHRGAAPHPRSGRGAAHRREAARGHPQVARRHRDRSVGPGARGGRFPVPGLYAAGEAAGFGGGGVHGYRALEGTFVGGCLFSGRVAGRAAAAAV